MARCMNKLSILIVPCHNEFNQSETVSAIVNYWEEINCKYRILEKVNLLFCSNPICRAEGNDYCEDGSSKCVHECSNFYRDLYDEIQCNSFSILESDNEWEKKEAKVL